MYTLSNAQLSVSILDPVADAARLGSRYCTGGYIWQVNDPQKGELLSGPEYPKEPNTFDGQGMPDMFHRPLGAEGVPVGGEVGCIGVGRVRRSSPIEPFDVRHNPQVIEFVRWEVIPVADAITMRTQAAFQEWAYRLERAVSLEGRQVLRDHQVDQVVGVRQALARPLLHRHGAVDAERRQVEKSRKLTEADRREVEKARVAEKYGADTITDLSMGGPIDEIRRRIREETDVPLTTVPIYQTVVEKGSFEAMGERDLMDMIRRHVQDGISSIVVHAGFTLEMLERLRGAGRIMGMVSKGGSFTAAWMLKSSRENPFLIHFDEICEILAERDVVLSP